MTRILDAATRGGHARLRRIGALLFAAALLATNACSGDSGSSGTTGPKNSPAGTYNLRTIDGNAPPVEVYHGPFFDAANQRFYNQMVVSIKRGTIELDDTDAWTMSFDAAITLDDVPTQQTIRVSGTYEISNGDLVLNAETGAVITGSVTKGTVAVTMQFANNNRMKSYSFTR